MLKIRLRRTGAKKKPNYRVVVADALAPRDGRFIDLIGFYDPLTDPATVRIDEEKARTWLEKGAKPSDRVAKLLARAGLIEAPPIPVAPERPAAAKAAPGKAATATAAPAIAAAETETAAAETEAAPAAEATAPEAEAETAPAAAEEESEK